MDREAFRAQVATAATPLVSRLETYLGGQHGLAEVRRRLTAAADRYATRLQEPDEQEQAARELCFVLFGTDAPPLDFWPTEAGEAVAWAIGHPHPWVSTVTARSILGVSRQRIHELIAEGQLESKRDSPDSLGRTAVSAVSIRHRLRLLKAAA